jgi:hypothetical protein
MPERIKLHTLTWYVRSVDYVRTQPYAEYQWVKSAATRKRLGLRLRVGSKLIGVFWL